MNTRLIRVLGLMVAVAGACWFIAGCEDNVDTSAATEFFQDGYTSAERSDASGDLQLRAASANLSTDGETTEIMGIGGQLPYTWSVVFPSLGQIVSVGDANCTYMRSAEGVNTVRVQDAAGDSATINISQAADTNTTANLVSP